MYSMSSLVPRPPPRFYLTALEKKQTRLRDKIWEEALEWGLLMFNHAVPDLQYTIAGLLS